MVTCNTEVHIQPIMIQNGNVLEIISSETKGMSSPMVYEARSVWDSFVL
jgi:hypothetical protein